MNQYYYVNSKGSGQQYDHQRNGRVYSIGRMSPVEIESFDLMEPPFNWVTPAGKKDVAEQESFSGWTKPADNYTHTSHGHFEKSMLTGNHDDWESQLQPAQWPPLPESPGIGHQGPFSTWAQPLNSKGMSAQGHYQGLAPSAGSSGFIPQNQLLPLTQPMNPSGMTLQGQPGSWAPPFGNKAFNSQNQPFPWMQPGNPAGMFANGKPATNPYGFNANGQQANYGGFGKPAAWTGQGNPMGWGGPGFSFGWGNNGGNDRPGIFGNLLKLGKGTMNGIGIISSLIGMGKFLF